MISVSEAVGIYNGSPFPATATIAGIVAGRRQHAGQQPRRNVASRSPIMPARLPPARRCSGPPTAAGSYTVEASFAGSTDYLSFGKPYSFVIFQAAPVFTVSDAGGTFNGSPFPGTGPVAGVVPGVDNTPGSSLEGVNLTLLYYAGEHSAALRSPARRATPAATPSKPISREAKITRAGGKGYFVRDFPGVAGPHGERSRRNRTTTLLFRRPPRWRESSPAWTTRPAAASKTST